MIGLNAGDIAMAKPPYAVRIVGWGAGSSVRRTRNRATSVPSFDRYTGCDTVTADGSGAPGRSLHCRTPSSGVQRNSVGGRAKPVNENTATSSSRLVVNPANDPSSGNSTALTTAPSGA